MHICTWQSVLVYVCGSGYYCYLYAGDVADDISNSELLYFVLKHVFFFFYLVFRLARLSHVTF